MTDNLRDIAIALCMETSVKKNVNRPLTIAGFYELLSAIERYNDNSGSSAQMNLFEQSHRYEIEFAYLRDIEADFMTQDLGLKCDLSERIVSLLKRISSLAFELEKLESQGIKVCTIFDDDYPEKLKTGLKNMPHSLREPPLLYCCGDLSIAKSNFAGFVGSRDVGEDDIAWTQRAIEKIYAKAERDQQIFGIVSGGAEGVDKISEGVAI